MQLYAYSKILNSKPLWTTSEIATIIGKNRVAAKVYAHRMVKSGLLIGVKKGVYSTTDDIFLICTNIANGSYISFISALNFHHLSTQMPSNVYVVVPRKQSPLSGVKWVRFPPSKIFGFRRVRIGNGSMAVAEPEKAIVDIAYRPNITALAHAYESIGSCNKKKLIAYARRMNVATLKRISNIINLARKKPKMAGSAK